MEQLTPITYSFSAFARSVEGTVQPFLLEISEPEEDEDGVCTCSVSCPFLRAKPYLIHGADEIQAVELSRRLVESLLEHQKVQLLDGDGHSVELPTVPASGY